jgi:hypothetical protein
MNKEAPMAKRTKPRITVALSETVVYLKSLVTGHCRVEVEDFFRDHHLQFIYL